MWDIKHMLKLYFVAGTQDCYHLGGNASKNLLDILEQALKSGIRCFQFRDKGEYSLESQPEKQRTLAIKCRELCHYYQIPFIVNDNVELALAIHADGVHLGQTDFDIDLVRTKIKKPFILGLSINNLQQALASKDITEVDYLGVGPIFNTQSKLDAGSTLGIEFINSLKLLGITKPIVAIGGINEQNAFLFSQIGIDGIAVISAITKSPDIAKTVNRLLLLNL